MHTFAQLCVWSYSFTHATPSHIVVKSLEVLYSVEKVKMEWSNKEARQNIDLFTEMKI